MNTSEAVLARIFAYVKENNISNVKLAVDTNTPLPTLNGYKGGKRKLSLDFVLGFLAAYPVSAEWILRGNASESGATYNVDLSDTSISGGTNSFGSGNIKESSSTSVDKEMVSAILGALKMTQQQNADLLETVKKLSSK